MTQNAGHYKDAGYGWNRRLTLVRFAVVIRIG